MTTEWRITQKPDFYKALLALSPKEIHQVLDKINLLFPAISVTLILSVTILISTANRSCSPGKRA